MKKIQQILILLTCILVLAAVALSRDGKLWGNDISLAMKQGQDVVADTMTTTADGMNVVHTKELGKDVFGYAGTTPLEIYLREGKVVKVKALENTETPDFFAEAATILTAWEGKTIAEAQTLKVDAVSGATLSSNAIIENVRRGLSYAQQHSMTAEKQGLDLSAKSLIALIVVLMAAIVPLFSRHRYYRLTQLILNVVVLGFWCGTFLNYTFFVSMMSNGISLSTSLVLLAMLVVAFVYPFFGKPNHYCNHICPLGSLQELAGRTNARKWHFSPATVRRLNVARELLWALLMLLMLAGVGFEWMDYEPFSAFLFTAAPAVAIILAVVFTLLSFFVPRCYCRFVCPTGTLFKLTQHSKQ